MMENAAVRFGAVSVISKSVRFGSVRCFFCKISVRFGSVRFGYLLYMSRFDAVSVFIPGFELMHTKLTNIPRASLYRGVEAGYDKSFFPALQKSSSTGSWGKWQMIFPSPAKIIQHWLRLWQKSF